MNFFKKQWNKGLSGVFTLQSPSGELAAALAAVPLQPKFIAGFVSPHVEIEAVAQTIRNRFPGVPVMLCSTAGELCSSGGGVYCPTEQSWDRVVLQCFDESLIAQVKIAAVPLGSEDLRRGKSDVSTGERVARITRQIESLQVDMQIDHRNTLAYVLIDGLSSSESFFMEALYDSGRFPCLFVGGSAGGKLDFQHTWIHDGQKKLENHALVAFLKVAEGVRFGVFKSQNFEVTPTVFHVIRASLSERHVSHVIARTGRVVPFIEALCENLQCSATTWKRNWVSIRSPFASARGFSSARYPVSTTKPAAFTSSATLRPAKSSCSFAARVSSTAPNAISASS